MARRGQQPINQRVLFVRAETDLFSEPPYDVTIQNSATVEYHPLNSVADRSAPIQFFIQGNDVQYVDLTESKLYLRCKITDANGGNIPFEADHNVLDYAPVNNLLHTMFSNVSVHFNEVEVTSKGSLYSHRAYIETLLSKSKEFKKSQGEACMFYRTKSELTTVDDGYAKRRSIVDGSNIFEMIGRPHSEMFTQNRFVMAGIDIRVQFNRNSDAFCLMMSGTAPVDVRLCVMEAKLIVQKHALLSSIQLDHIRTWESGHPIAYPMRRVDVRSYSLPVGTTQHTSESLITGFLPDRLVLGLVKGTTLHGAYNTNCLAFEHFGLQHITVTTNSDQVQRSSMDMDFDASRAMQPYLSVFEGLGIANQDPGIDLSYEEYKNGKTLFVYDLRHLREAFCPPRHGNVSITLRFKNAIAHSLSVIAYLEYQAVMYINSDKQVYFRDFSKNP